MVFLPDLPDYDFPGSRDIVSVAATYSSMFVVHPNGKVSFWGSSWFEDYNDLRDIVGVAAADYPFFLLKSGGVIAGETRQFVPGVTNLIEFSIGGDHGLGLKSDGTVLAFPLTRTASFTNIPPGLTGVKGLVASIWMNLALKKDGTVVAWDNVVS